MAVDPQTVDALTTEALRAQAAIAAGISLDCDGLPTTTVTYGYDANGNQTTRTTQRDGNTTIETFIFDTENRLVGYRKSVDGSPIHAASTSYTYDADGVRTSKTTNSQTILYTTDKNRPYAQVLEEREAKTGDLIVRYTYGDDLISQSRPQTGSADVTRYYHYDGQMSTRHLTDDSTIATSVATTDRYTYDALGNDLGNDGTTANAYRYTGEQFDEAVGQYYLRARYYDQGVGRFMAQDFVEGNSESPLTLNQYLSVLANPINNIDPSGLFAAALGAGGGLGGSAFLGASIRSINGALVSATTLKLLKLISLIMAAAVLITVAVNSGSLDDVIEWSRNPNNTEAIRKARDAAREAIRRALRKLKERVKRNRNEPDDLVLFHYTTEANSQSIEASQQIEGNKFARWGAGAYATDIEGFAAVEIITRTRLIETLWGRVSERRIKSSAYYIAFVPSLGQPWHKLRRSPHIYKNSSSGKIDVHVLYRGQTLLGE